GRQGVVVDVAPGERGHLVVEQADEQPRDARLGLAPLAEEDHVLAAEDRVLDLRDDGVVVADDAGQEPFVLAQSRNQVVAQLLLDRLSRPAALPKLSDRAWLSHDCGQSITWAASPRA